MEIQNKFRGIAGWIPVEFPEEIRKNFWKNLKILEELRRNHTKNSGGNLEQIPGETFENFLRNPGEL